MKNNVSDNRVYPIKVRLIKPNPTNDDRIMFNDIALYTYKDTVIENAEILMKIQPLQNYLIIKSDVVESKAIEVTDEDNDSDEIKEE